MKKLIFKVTLFFIPFLLIFIFPFFVLLTSNDYLKINRIIIEKKPFLYKDDIKVENIDTLKYSFLFCEKKYNLFDFKQNYSNLKDFVGFINRYDFNKKIAIIINMFDIYLFSYKKVYSFYLLNKKSELDFKAVK